MGYHSSSSNTDGGEDPWGRGGGHDGNLGHGNKYPITMEHSNTDPYDEIDIDNHNDPNNDDGRRQNVDGVVGTDAGGDRSLYAPRATRFRTLYGWVHQHKWTALLGAMAVLTTLTVIAVSVAVPTTKATHHQQQFDNIDDEGNRQPFSLGNTGNNATTTDGTVVNSPTTAAPVAAGGGGGVPSLPPSTIPPSSASPSDIGGDVVVTDSPSSSPLSGPVGVTDNADEGYCQGEYYACHSPNHKDRLGHQDVMPAGRAVCSQEFRFGLTIQGRLQWKDCLTNATHTLWDANTAIPDMDQDTLSGLEFVMEPNAAFRVVLDGGDVVLWEKKCLKNVQFYSQCLASKKLDCPYLHLHENGDLVMNHIRPNGGGWQAVMSQDGYWDLWWHSNDIPVQNELSRIQTRYPDPDNCIHFSDDFECLQDKMGTSGTNHSTAIGINNKGSQFVLPYGKAVCRGNYMFGFSTVNRALQWKNCQTNETKKVLDASAISKKYGHDALPYTYLVMSTNASLQVGVDAGYFWTRGGGGGGGSTNNASSSSVLFWQLNATMDVPKSKACVTDDWLLDCPFIQLSDSGNVNLNYIGENSFGNGTTLLRPKMEKIYQNLF